MKRLIVGLTGASVANWSWSPESLRCIWAICAT
jgi:hypothetical protein